MLNDYLLRNEGKTLTDKELKQLNDNIFIQHKVKVKSAVEESLNEE